MQDAESDTAFNTTSSPPNTPLILLDNCFPETIDGQDVLGQALLFCQQSGWVPIPVHPKSKQPKRLGWQHSTLATPLDDFAIGDNIGVLLGEPSGGLVDVDLDCPEAVELANHFLPATDLIFGPETDPRSHWLYRVNECGHLSDQKNFRRFRRGNTPSLGGWGDITIAFRCPTCENSS